MLRTIYLIISVFCLWGCSHPQLKHLDFKAWERTPDCCSASGKSVGVASGGTFSSKAGLEIAQLGGNVVDIAVATAFALAVERPHSLGLGGGGFLTLYLADEKPTTIFVDFRETAPAKANPTMFLGPKGNLISGLSRYGILSVATPGFVPGLFTIHQKWGKLPWKTILRPAIHLAQKGFPIYLSLAKAIEEEREHLLKEPYTASLLFNKRGLLKTGDTLIQEDLARTLERVSKNPSWEFKTGTTAKLIDRFVREKGGILSISDLAHYRPEFRAPINHRWKDFVFVTAPPPSAGGVIMTEMLQTLAKDDLSHLSETDYLHLLTEAMKRAYSDRSRFIGDPDFSHEDITSLLTAEYGASLRKTISLDQATPAKEISPGAGLPKMGDHTTHLSVMDAAGNGAAMTLTINDHFGSRLAVPGTGIFLNDEMDDFSAKIGAPNLFGLLGGKANQIEPQKRPASSMSPTLLIKNGKVILSVGAAGGSKITSNTFEVILNVLFRFPNDLKHSVFAPRIHHQWSPDELQVEAGFLPAVISGLKEKGHNLREVDKAAIVQATFVDPLGNITAVYDPRDEGGAEAK
ncbi:MAG: gamma-glutamyltransferase [Proteobacteria bacterium]|nr:gamma-glutamyltransferase [Pseudomonadota bacterium]NDC23060.1 gamma-glutamyltransferase [Pseudomonadota bacterium]NDD04344.1 gamma-glutamyltransferase [Pseudomonadota bacterium]NDG25549.1 gamma-glutamyltransferase [Pseudomonadota bacterium]